MKKLAFYINYTEGRFKKQYKKWPEVFIPMFICRQRLCWFIWFRWGAKSLSLPWRVLLRGGRAERSAEPCVGALCLDRTPSALWNVRRSAVVRPPASVSHIRQH
jgi:hypothetical protein